MREIPSNKELVLARLRSTTRKQEYNKISQNQIDKGILEKVPQQQSGDIIHHINHQDLTKQLFKNMRIANDCSTKQTQRLD